MAGLNVTLNIAAQTLMNTQTELSTASNNISNANTTGYAVETAVQTQNPSTQMVYGYLGAGASVTSISQARDNFLEQQLMNAASSDSQFTSQASELSTIQSVASDSGSTGISQALGNFFDAWSTLSQNPTGVAEQSAVYSAGQNLASAIQTTYNQLDNINGQLTTQISDTATQANTLLTQIAQLNTGIARGGTTPTSQPNDLINQQYAAIDSLSKLIPVTFSKQSDGTFTVTATVNGSSQDLVTAETVNYSVNPTDSVGGGQLGGLQDAQTQLSGYMGQLDNFAEGVINNFKTSFGPQAVFQGTDATSIAANTNYLSTLPIDAAQMATDANTMSSLQDQSLTFSDGTNSTLQGYLGTIQSSIGTDAQTANTNQSYYDSLKSELQNQQQSVSGVSMDEEMVHVIQFQQIYQAAAKVVTTTATLMNTAINMVQ
ncbi:MAG: flagellar hook-associated protein FlgK [Syntrophobacteraceae bacterium]